MGSGEGEGLGGLLWPLPTHGHGGIWVFCPVLNDARPCVLCQGASPAQFLSPVPHGRHRAGHNHPSPEVPTRPQGRDHVPHFTDAEIEARSALWPGRDRAVFGPLVLLALKPVHGSALLLAEFGRSFRHPRGTCHTQDPTCRPSWHTLSRLLPFLLPLPM